MPAQDISYHDLQDTQANQSSLDSQYNSPQPPHSVSSSASLTVCMSFFTLFGARGRLIGLGRRLLSALTTAFFRIFGGGTFLTFLSSFRFSVFLQSFLFLFSDLVPCNLALYGLLVNTTVSPLARRLPTVVSFWQTGNGEILEIGTRRLGSHRTDCLGVDNGCNIEDCTC